jgi:hypothetical protein
MYFNQSPTRLETSSMHLKPLAKLKAMMGKLTDVHGGGWSLVCWERITELLHHPIYIHLLLYRTNTVIYLPVAKGAGTIGVNCTRSRSASEGNRWQCV